MNFINNQIITLTAHKSGKGEPFHFKPVWIPHLHSLADINYANENPEIYNVSHLLVPVRVQIFWMWFYLQMDIKPKKLSETKMVNYNATHFALIDRNQPICDLKYNENLVTDVFKSLDQKRYDKRLVIDVLSKCECDGTLNEYVKKYQPKYFINGWNDVAKIRLFKDLGYL